MTFKLKYLIYQACCLFKNIEEMIENFEELSTKNHEPHEAKVGN